MHSTPPPPIHEYRLGKAPAREDTRTLRLARYLPVGIPKPPRASEWQSRIGAWPMLGNDRIGDCTCAAAAHHIHAWTAANQHAVLLMEPAVIAAYSAITGYTPARPDSDRGAVMLDVCRYWRTHGLAGHRIEAFAALNPRDRDDWRYGVHLFGGVYAGLSLPLSVQHQRVWATGASFEGAYAKGSWGGHAVAVVGYDAAGLTCITWGAVQRMTWEFAQAYADEAFALITPDWVAANAKSPSGFDLATLRADLVKIKG